MSVSTMRDVLAAAWRDARRVRLWLPLYLLSLALGFAQTWPLIDNRALHNPYLSDLAAGGSEAWTAAAVSNPAGATVMSGLYVLTTLALTMLFGGAYNFVSGALLTQWAGAGRYRSGGVRYFLTFGALGVMLLILAALALAISTGLLVAGGGMAAVIVAWALVQLVNVLGEYARVLAIARSRRNPFAVLGMGAAFIVRHVPGAALFAVFGVLVQGTLWAAFAAVTGVAATWPPAVTFVIQQAFICALLWSKVFRLALAWHFVRVAASPRSSPAAVSPAPAAV